MMLAVNHRSHIDGLRISGPTPSAREQQATVIAIEQGIRLCKAEGLAQPTLRQAIWRLLKEAMRTEQAFPDKERSWLEKMVNWPELPYTEIERQIQAAGDYELRTLRNPESGKPTDRLEMESVNRIAVRDRAAFDRYLTVMGWLRFVRGRNVMRDKDIVLSLARGNRVHYVRAVYMASCGDAAVDAVKDKVLHHIARAIWPFCKKRIDIS